MRCSCLLLNLYHLGIAMAILASTSASWGQSTTSTDEAAVRQAAKAYISALRRGDAVAACAAWTDDGKYIDAAGRIYKARDFVKQNIGPAKTGDVTEEIEDTLHSTIRFPTPNVAVEEGGSADSNTGTSSYSAIWVKQGDSWLLESVHESHLPATNPLSALAWLVGEWSAKHGELQVHCTTKWSDNDRFILQQFVVEKSGHEVHNGSQRIGWDASTKSIRSWVFDSNGGFSEGTWRNEEAGWIVKSKGVLPDGGTSVGVHFWIPEGENRIAVKHTHVAISGAPVKDIELVFERVTTH